MEQAITVHIPSNELEEEDDSKSSSRDIDRGEELWRDKNEMFFRKLQSECKQLSKQHDIASHRNKKKYACMECCSGVRITSNTGECEYVYRYCLYKYNRFNGSIGDKWNANFI